MQKAKKLSVGNATIELRRCKIRAYSCKKRKHISELNCIGGPSLGHGMLFVTTGSPAEVSSNKGGYIVAFGLPSSDTGTNVGEKAGCNLTTNTSPKTTSAATEVSNSVGNATTASNAGNFTQEDSQSIPTVTTASIASQPQGSSRSSSSTDNSIISRKVFDHFL